jgi:hypothetical protein
VGGDGGVDVDGELAAAGVPARLVRVTEADLANAGFAAAVSREPPSSP